MEKRQIPSLLITRSGKFTLGISICMVDGRTESGRVTFRDCTDRDHEPVSVAKMRSLYSAVLGEGGEEVEMRGVALSEHRQVLAKVVLGGDGGWRRERERVEIQNTRVGSYLV